MMFLPADLDFWPDVPPDEAMFIHRLAIRRSHAGGALSSAMLDWAVEQTRKSGRH
jgi:hypothetical protein